MDMSPSLIGHDRLLAFLTPTTLFRRLAILLVLRDSPEQSQHKIALATGLSSAMVNTYIKRLAKDQLLARSRPNDRDMRYSLTPAGEQELARLFSRYSAEIVQLYTQAKQEICRQLASILPGDAPRRLVLFGASETCELVLQALKGFPQAVIAGIVDSAPAKHGRDFHGHRVAPPTAVERLDPDIVLITSFACQEEIYQAIRHLEPRGIQIKKLADI